MAVIANIDVGFRAMTGDFASKVKGIGASIGGFVGKVGGLVGTLGPIGVALTGIAGAAGLVSGVFSQFDELGDIGDSAEKLGLTTEALIGLRHGAKFAGVEAAALETGIRNMQRTISGGSKAYEELGLNLAQLKTLSPEQQFDAVADALVGVSNQGDKLRLAMEVLGKPGADLLPFLKDGKAGLQAMKDEAKGLGLTVDEEGAAAADQAGETFEKLQLGFKGMMRQLAVAVAPFVTDMIQPMVDGLISFMPTFQNWLSSLVTGVKVIIFAFQNWQDVLKLAFMKVQLAAIGFGNNILHMFTDAIPNALGAFGRFLKEAFDNFTSGNFTADFGKLGDELSGALTRPVTDTEKQLQQNIDALGGDLTNRLGEFLKKPEAKAKEKKAAIELPLEVQEAVKVQVQDISASALQRNSVDAFSAVQAARRAQGKSVEEKILKESMEQTKKLGQIVQKLDKGNPVLQEADI